MSIKKNFVNAIDKDVADAVSKISFRALSSVIKKTPIDTGRAKNSWNLSEGKIDTSLDSSVRDEISGKKDVFITNSLPYINRLENGYSKQAPKGMVAITINELVRG